jgi:hypothetical protein
MPHTYAIFTNRLAAIPKNHVLAGTLGYNVLVSVMFLLALVMGFYVFELRLGVGFVSDARVIDFADKSLPFLVFLLFYRLKMLGYRYVSRYALVITSIF